MLKRLFLIILSLLCTVHGYANGNTQQVHQSIERILVSNPDTALMMAQNLLKQGTINKDTAEMIYASRMKAEALTALDRYTESLTLLKTCAEILTKKNQQNTMEGARLMADMAKSLARIDQLADASEYYFKALPIYEQLASHAEMANMYIDMAEFYRLKNADTITHQQYLDKAYTQMVMANEPEVYCRYYNRLAALKTIEGKYDSSVYYSRVSIKYAKQAGDINNEAWSLNEIGYVLWNCDYERVCPEYLQAARLFKQINDIQGECRALINQARADVHQQHFARAKMLLNSCREMLGPKTTLFELEARLYYEYYVYFNTAGDKDSALHYFEIQNNFKVAEMGRHFDDKIAYQESKFDNTAKQKTINEKEQQIALEQKSASLRTIQRNVAIAGLITLIMVLGVLYIGFRRLRKGNHELLRLSNVIKQANESLSSSLQQKEVLLSEIHHRVKNNLQVVVSLLELQAENTHNPGPVSETITRVRSMGLVHEMLYQQHDVTELGMQLYAEQLYDVISDYHGKGKPSKTNIQCNGVFLHLDQAIPLGMVLNELFTNSWKHATINNRELQVNLKMICETGFCKLFYSDNGPGLPPTIDIENTNSIGIYLLRSMAQQLDGKLEYNWEEKHFLFIFPMTYGAEENIDSRG